MITYKQLQRDLTSKELFNSRITTIKGLKCALQDSAIVAIDTEHVAITSEKGRVLHQVGLAYCRTLSGSTLPSTNQPCLQEFYAKNQIQASTFNINIDENMPTRRSHRFGQEQRIDLEELGGAIVDFIESFHNDNKADLLLIGFEMEAEWTYLSRYFPDAIPFFSAWVDLRDIAKDITSIGVIPGLVPLLQIFGYRWKDIRPGKNPHGGVADNAGDDAIATCALADALLFSENQEKLKFRQECGQIARIFTKKKGYQVPDARDPFIATVRTRTQGPLPLTIDSGMKLARQFFEFSPQSAGIMCHEVAYLTFRCQDQMEEFIAVTNGRAILPTGDTLLIQRHSCGNVVRGDGNNEQKQKQELRKKRLESTESEVEGLESLFS
ncbi:hypothetical protein F4805DRAFT_456237 [Annulohypoxylon moriforme]|nr:hypothetical protein F4805DRAFT_456237 [Annulohypoxylon moriforme]